MRALALLAVIFLHTASASADDKTDCKFGPRYIPSFDGSSDGGITALDERIVACFNYTMQLQAKLQSEIDDLRRTITDLEVRLSRAEQR